MTSLYALILGIVWIFLVYKFYAKRVDQKIIMADSKKTTPAVMYMDGVEFMPANKNVLFGFQYKSICGIGPVAGAIFASNWGWLPAMLYLMLGVALLGWVHDYSSTIVGVRREGMSLGGMSYTLISPRARTLISIFIYFNLMLSFGAFAVMIASNLTVPTGPLGIIIWVLMGLVAGQMIYKWKQSIVTTTLVTVVITFIGIFYLTSLGPVTAFFKAVSGGDKPPIIFGVTNQAQFIWVLAVLVFCYFGAVLPIWRWAQPINYLGFWVVFIGMVCISLGIIFWNPSFTNFPAYKGWWWGTNPLWPILFVTLMCGAVSGWHSLVGSSGTARMLEKEDFEVILAGDGPEGLRLAKEARPDIITLDVLMPGLDGWAVLKALKADLETADIPVIMLTIVENRQLGMSLGASDYLSKPIDRRRLQALLKKYRREGTGCRALVVEDDTETRNLLRRTMEKDGWAVAEAVDGVAALDSVGKQLPHLILLDLQMPRMNGFEFIAEFRKNEAWRSVPVIVITALDLTAEDRARLSGQVETILQKGLFRRDDLLEEVRRLAAECHDRKI